MNAELQSWSCSGGQPVQDSFPIKRGKKFKGFPVHFCTSDSGKHSTIPHADQTDAWMLQWQELVRLTQSLVS